ncbi:MAG: hypothetical protein HC872_08575, partial [Gammaproteobacteria bacterium]|nr:hypothetical protein [Gammaproteobacteria bacterium]
MPWWGWLVAGIGLLAVEMFGIDAQFYLVFLGVSAILVGVLGLSGLSMPEWGEWLTFAVLSIVTMLASVVACTTSCAGVAAACRTRDRGRSRRGAGS